MITPSTNDPLSALSPVSIATVAVYEHHAVLAPERSMAPLPPIALIQPVSDVSAYLAKRKPAPHFAAEPELYATLPQAIRDSLKCLLGDEPGKGAFGYARGLVASSMSITRACAKSYDLFRSTVHVSLKRFRAQYDTWVQTKDWVSLVNRSKAGARWQDREDGLPELFLEFCESRFGKFRREDAKRQALFTIYRQWQTGRTIKSEREPIPGYGSVPVQLNGRPVTGGYWQDWAAKTFPGKAFAEAPLPPGWSYSNIMRQVKSRAKLNKAVKLLLQQGISAAKEVLPHHLISRKDLRFLETVTFDDVRTDWLIFDPESGQACELWLLVARDQATAMVLGFVMHPATLREDGSASHLGLQEMKQLAAWLLERYPLPPYLCTWRVERGTATLPEACALALSEMLPSRIKLSYTGMIGGKSPLGYREKAKGNSRGKASHESHNRLFHTQSCDQPGQTGARYEIRPAELKARCNECVEIWEMRNRLPEHLRGTEKYPLLLPEQAREQLTRICLDQNFRTDHKLEGFDQVLEWLDPASGKWMPQTTYPGTPGVEFRRRMEMPVERAIKLMAGYQWSKVSPDVIIAFLSHTLRTVIVKDNGEVIFRHEDREYTFAPPPGLDISSLGSQLGTGRNALGYFHPDDPSYLHLTTGRGSILGTWFRRARLGQRDQELLEQAMRYTANALKSAQEYAAALTSEERAGLDAMRAHNAELERGNQFIAIASAPDQAPAIPSLGSPVAHALATQRPIAKAQAKDRAETEQDARQALRDAML